MEEDRGFLGGKGVTYNSQCIMHTCMITDKGIYVWQLHVHTHQWMDDSSIRAQRNIFRVVMSHHCLDIPYAINEKSL